MNKSEYMQLLLELCSERQQAFFRKIYPDGPTSRQIDSAIRQITTTLKKGNQDTENLKNRIHELEEKEKDKNRINSEYHRTITGLEQEIKALKSNIEQLENPINTENADIQKQLMKLQALEYGGVDNWAFYEEAISNYEKEFGVDL